MATSFLRNGALGLAFLWVTLAIGQTKTVEPTGIRSVAQSVEVATGTNGAITTTPRQVSKGDTKEEKARKGDGKLVEGSTLREATRSQEATVDNFMPTIPSIASNGKARHPSAAAPLAQAAPGKIR